MIDAYEKSAERLMNASTEDRAWVLAQLSPEDRIRVVAMLRDLVEIPGEIQADTEDFTQKAGSRKVSPEHEMFPALANADSAAIEELLEGEPDWMVAMLVRDARWPWVERFLSGLDPVRLESIECWVRIGHDTIKPAVVELLFKLTNEKLTRPEGSSAVPTAFEDILARLRTRAPDRVHNNMQESE